MRRARSKHHPISLRKTACSKCPARRCRDPSAVMPVSALRGSDKVRSNTGPAAPTRFQTGTLISTGTGMVGQSPAPMPSLPKARQANSVDSCNDACREVFPVEAVEIGSMPRGGCARPLPECRKMSPRRRSAGWAALDPRVLPGAKVVRVAALTCEEQGHWR